jgi:hypothetical membrane protein
MEVVSIIKERYYAVSGILAPIVAVVFITASIMMAPWFNWNNNALSDLGHSAERNVAPFFNLGLLLCGFLTIIYSLTSFRSYARYTSYFLILAGLALQLVATFDEAYGVLHFQVSVLFFISLGFASISYFIEKRSIIAAAAFVVGSISWIFFGLKVYNTGIAVPEAISSIATASWFMVSALRLYSNDQ